jgi:hypothetical protein
MPEDAGFGRGRFHQHGHRIYAPEAGRWFFALLSSGRGPSNSRTRKALAIRA